MKQLRILIIRRDNIGDLILTTPLFEALRQRFPCAYLAVLTNSYNKDAICGNPHVDDIYSYTKGKHTVGDSVLLAYLHRLKLIWLLRRKRFDYVILPNGGFAKRAFSFAKLVRSRHIVGFFDGERSPRGLDHPVSHEYGGSLHETEDIFRLLTPFGISGAIPSFTVVADTAVADRLCSALPPHVLQGGGPLVALHISARKEKQRWPVAHFSQLAHRLHALIGAKFLLFWSPGDENNPFHPGDDGKAAKLLADMADLPVAPVNTNHLSELIAGLSICDAAVLSDGGAMHVAAGLGKPMVCFFGNSPAGRWHPWGVPYRLLQKPSRDVADISVDEAEAAFMDLITPQG